MRKFILFTVLMFFIYSCSIYNNPFAVGSFVEYPQDILKSVDPIIDPTDDPVIDPTDDNLPLPLVNEVITFSTTTLNYYDILIDNTEQISIEISNSGTVPIEWKVVDFPLWLTSDLTSDQIAPSSSKTIIFSTIAQSTTITYSNSEIIIDYNYIDETSVQQIINASSNIIDDSITHYDQYKFIDTHQDYYTQGIEFTVPDDKEIQVAIWYYVDTDTNNYHTQINGRANIQLPVFLNKIGIYKESSGHINTNGKFRLFRDQPINDASYKLHIWRITYELDGNIVEKLAEDAVYYQQTP